MLTAPTEHPKVEPEVRDSIRLRDRSKDDVDIVEDRIGCQWGGAGGMRPVDSGRIYSL